MRINKYLAKSGLGSRRFCDKLVKDHKILVNNNICNDLSYKVKRDDIVQFNGKIIYPKEKNLYYMFNKPYGVVTTLNDDLNRKDIQYYLHKNNIVDRVYPVGRLDYDTKGLIILTNDGDFTYKITHPSFEIKKVYIVIIDGVLNKKNKYILENGIRLEEGITSKCDINIIKKSTTKSKIEMIIHQGWNRQIRRMFNKVNHNVISLKRISIGNIRLNNLLEGEVREIPINDIKKAKLLIRNSKIRY